MPPLQFVCFNAAAVAGWINRQPGSQEIGLKLPKPPETLPMAMIGSSVVDWNGQPVVMICLQDGQRMAMLYILKPGDGPGLPEGATETMQQAGWVVRSTEHKRPAPPPDDQRETRRPGLPPAVLNRPPGRRCDSCSTGSGEIPHLHWHQRRRRRRLGGWESPLA